MCDTLVALGNSTKTGSVLFAKNSDRDFNEAQYIQVIRGQKYKKGETVKCTYIEIPQVNTTCDVLLSKPFWIWGAEMGANEKGVMIGNEAVFTKVWDAKTERLIGMDLLRLALERSSTAEEALHTIIELLEKHGQGGNCGFAHPFFYDNSYLIADAKEAWVLETAGRQWAAEKVKDIRSISNILTIETKWDLASKDLINYAVDRGWCKDRSKFNFKKCYSDLIYSTFGAGAFRHQCTTDGLRQKMGKLEVGDMMRALRAHAGDDDPGWKPDKALAGADVCMHAGFGPIRVSQTTGSMVSEMSNRNATHWLTGTSAPCTSLFKPVWIDAGIPDIGSEPKGTFDQDSFWWRHELLHRSIIKDYADRIQLIRVERDSIELESIQECLSIGSKGTSAKERFTTQCFEMETKQMKKWIEKVGEQKIKTRNAFYYDGMLRKINKKAKLIGLD